MPGDKHPPLRTSHKGDVQRGTACWLSAMRGYNHGQQPNVLPPGGVVDARCNIFLPLELGLDNRDAYMVSLVWWASVAASCPLA